MSGTGGATWFESELVLPAADGAGLARPGLDPRVARLRVERIGMAARQFYARSAALADEYRPSEFLGLELSQAVLSPKRLGPETQFAPVRVEARTDRKPVKTQRVVVSKEAAPKPQMAQHRVEKPRAAARTKLARRHSNPLDAQARDTRIQKWPCTSGGICGWQN